MSGMEGVLRVTVSLAAPVDVVGGSVEDMHQYIEHGLEAALRQWREIGSAYSVQALRHTDGSLLGAMTIAKVDVKNGEGKK